jgi:DNA-binding response OmpR family regulator
VKSSVCAKVLVVEDERPLAETLAYNLKRAGYEVRVVYDGASALKALRRDPPDLVVLDLMLPEVSGEDVCRVLRAESQAGVIMLTAKAEEEDKLAGLGLGADDYVTKPFSMKELMARVEAVLRRTGRVTDGAGEAIVAAGDVEIDPERHEVTVAGRSVDLSPKEFELLRVFVANAGRVLSRDTLLRQVWGDEAYRDPHTVNVHVRWLREKIERDPSRPTRIVTVRGFGYKFVEQR